MSGRAVLPRASLPRELSSPKLAEHAKSPAYRYYAGFSEQFVRELLSLPSLDEDDLILDVWNGSGTTTRTAVSLDLNTIGIDINPAMVVVAKARAMSEGHLVSASRILSNLAELAPYKGGIAESDPLKLWFEHDAVRMIRGIEMAIRGVKSERVLEPVDVENLTTIQAYLYTSLFLTVRGLLKSYIGTNPTWVRVRKPSEPATLVTWDQLRFRFLRAAVTLQTDVLPTPQVPKSPSLRLGTSTALSGDLPPVALVLTSPPYCTRIDYAIATRPELSILGWSEASQDALRRRMLGTTTVPGSLSVAADDLGGTATELLERVSNHTAKASHSYYWKWLAQYLVDYAKSLAEIARTLRGGGSAVLVVQDSYYKDIQIDLAKITQEIFALHDFQLAQSYQFRLSTTMAGVNRSTRRYRNEFSATEQILVFDRGAQEGIGS